MKLAAATIVTGLLVGIAFSPLQSLALFALTLLLLATPRRG